MAIVAGEPTSICIVWVAPFAADAFVPLSLQILLMCLLPCSSPLKAMVLWLYNTCMSHVKIITGSVYPSCDLHETYTFPMVETTCVYLPTYTWHLAPSWEGTRIYPVGVDGGRLVVGLSSLALLLGQ